MSNFHVGNPGLDIIKNFEQLRLVAYLPTPEDVWTIGWGHTKGVKPGDHCTVSQADVWLREDCAEAEWAVNSLVKVPINQNQFDALVSFAFNVGGDIDADTKAEGLGDSTLLRKLNSRDYVGAALEFPEVEQAGREGLGGPCETARGRANSVLQADLGGPMLIPKLYLIAGAALLSLAAVGVIAYQHRAINSLEAENAVMEADIAAKDSTIAAQKTGIAAMIKTAAAAEVAMKSAGDTIESLNTALDAARSRRNAKVEKDYALPDCAALLALDLASVCPAHAQRLRDAATNR